MTRPDSERISVVETKMDDLKNKVDEIGVDVKDIKSSMNTVPNLYLTRQEFIKFKDDKTITSWFTHTLTAVLTAVFIFLIINFLGGK